MESIKKEIEVKEQQLKAYLRFNRLFSALIDARNAESYEELQRKTDDALILADQYVKEYFDLVKEDFI